MSDLTLENKLTNQVIELKAKIYDISVANEAQVNALAGKLGEIAKILGIELRVLDDKALEDITSNLKAQIQVNAEWKDNELTIDK